VSSHRCVVGALVIGCTGILVQACGGGAGGGLGGTFTSVENDALTMQFKSGGTVVMAAAGLGSSSGTYTVDGEKILVNIDNQQHTFILDGKCVEEPRQIYGKLCKGGKAGAESNVSTRNVPTAPSGTYVATNADGEFKLVFKPGNTLTMSMTPAGGNPETVEGSFTIEGDKLYATLNQGTPMVLTFVNNTYESTAFGLPMKFVRQ
jgi:hypothetical protein